MFVSTDGRRACRRGAIGSTMGAYPRDTGSNPVEGNGHFFPSYRQLYLSSFSDTHTHTHTHTQKKKKKKKKKKSQDAQTKNVLSRRRVQHELARLPRVACQFPVEQTRKVYRSACACSDRQSNVSARLDLCSKRIIHSFPAGAG